MISYLVIGLCIVLLLAVTIISAKPISMGIEARRNINVSDSNNDTHYDVEFSDKKDSNNLSDEISKLEEVNKNGILTDEEYENCIKNQSVEPFMRQKLVEFNLGSRKQIGEYLIDFGWKPERFTPTGQPIVDEGTLKKIEHIEEAKLIACLLYTSDAADE